MPNQSYMEIPGAGVYSQTPRPFASLRRSLRSYRFCLGATALTVIAVTLVAVISVLVVRKIESNISSNSGSNSGKGRSSSFIALPPGNRTLTTLLSLTWPRRDCNWYRKRWSSTMMPQGNMSTVSNGTRPIKELGTILKASPLSTKIVVDKTKNPRTKRNTYRQDMQLKKSQMPTKQTMPNFKTTIKTKKSQTLPQNKNVSSTNKSLPNTTMNTTELSTGKIPLQEMGGDWVDDWKEAEENKYDKEWEDENWDDDEWMEDWMIDHQFDDIDDSDEEDDGKSYRINTSRKNHRMYQEFGENSDAPDGERWTKPDGSTFPSNDTFHWNRRPGNLPRCSDRQVDRILSETSRRHNKLDSLETMLYARNLTLHKGTASHYHQHGFRRTSPRAKKMARQGRIMEWATKLVKRKLKLSKEQVTFDGQWLNDLRNSPYCDVSDDGQRRHCRKSYPYRTADGSCNNLQHPTWGKSFSEYRRLLPPDYGDGISTPRLSKMNDWLPSARAVSSKVHVDTYAESKSYTMLAMSWGQFIDHDITATAQSKGINGSSLTCCNKQIRLDSSIRHPECFPIEIPRDDPFYAAQDVRCMEFSRSSPSAHCKLGPREQLNQLTSFLDGSVIYGSSQEEQDELRTHKDGLLISQVTMDGQELLMASFNMNDSCNIKTEAQYNRFCFKSGDSRVNEHILLTVLHTSLVRQHNSLAITLRDMNQHWNDETIFQESRKIVIAQIQHITYHEYIPSILGPVLSKGLNLSPNFDKHFDGYREDVNPGIANEFAAAAFRFGHSMIQGLIQKIDKAGKNVEFEQMKKYYFSPFTLYDLGSMSSFIRGEVSQMAHAVDTYFTTQVTNRLFQPKGAKFGLDLVAINIQRGRDHGIAGYTRWRMLCGLTPVLRFQDLEEDMDSGALHKIMTVYKDVDDIDLFTGGLAEKPLPDALVGPTFGCILADQFLRLKIGDRFWYETDQEPQKFTKGQLYELQKTSLARLLCDNTEDVGSIQRWPMRRFATGNPRLPCSSKAIPRVDLGPWEEGDI